jgi:glycosyltransferase involved in cell wall biosynthesis/cellulose synthase/poly-beta-1,6-N-acetylglucosamine synthase-like glycosyltransferase
MFWETVFGLAALPLLASYFGYPLTLVLWVGARRLLRGRRRPVAQPPGAPLPRVSILVAAYNEEAVIVEKLRNFLELDYPPERVDLTVVSDGSTDRTCALARNLLASLPEDHAARVRIVERGERTGKTVAISQAVGQVDGEILVFTDANTMFRSDCVRRLVQPFADSRVGLACGHLRYLTRERAATTGEALYWRYENTLKRLEGALGELLAANGSIYAVRRELFHAVPGPVADDLAVPLSVASQGYQRRYVSSAVVYEQLPELASEQFRSKARIVAQGFEALRALRPEIRELGATRFAQLLLHKVIRWFAAPLMGIMLIASLLGSGPLLRAMLTLQLGFYALAALGWAVRNTAWAPSALLLPFYFCLVNAAALRGFIDFARGRSYARWEKSASTREAGRTDPAEPPRILFFSHYFPPEGNAPASRVYELCKRWVRAGHRVQVITCAPNVPDGRVYPGYRNRWLLREEIDGIEVLRVWTVVTPNEGKIRTLSFLSYLLMATLRGLRVERPDVILATSPQFFCGWAGVLTHWLRRRPLILEIRDIWPDSIVAVGAIRSRALIRFMEWLERRMYAAASHVVTVSEGCRQILLDKGVPGSALSVITNGIDHESFVATAPDPALRRQWGLEGRFVCAYVGTIGLACSLDVVIRAAHLLKQAGRDDIAFLLVGDGATREPLQRAARSLGLGNVVFLGRQPKAAIPAILASADCCLVHLRKTQLFESALPSKTFEAMAMVRPIVMGVAGEAAQLIRTANAGLCIEPEDEKALLGALEKLRGDPELCRRFGENGREYVARHYDRERLAEDYLGLLTRALGWEPATVAAE